MKLRTDRRNPRTAYHKAKAAAAKAKREAAENKTLKEAGKA